ncbi:MAG TPA: lipopolysaccharide heptosyltransferase II [Vicinamibacterales bacterium]|nr:lipopolysaccharide heptosyltransferase II [Vicinamibacterales bacterium]
MKRPVILAPNWLGDAVMSLPAIADIRRAVPTATLTVAARPAIAPLFSLVSGIDETIVLSGRRRPYLRLGAVGFEGFELRGRGLDVALLMPNSLHSAIVVARAGIPERWGYRANWRGRLLTRTVVRPSGLHQVEYYQHLVRCLGFPGRPEEPRLSVSEEARSSGVRALVAAGWDGKQPIVALAPGAAYGGAKRWPPASFAQLADTLLSDGVRSVLVGALPDSASGKAVQGAVSRSTKPLNVVGRTDLPTLAGVLAACRALITNDSGAMHLAAAIGTPVTALFGPTDEQATRPVGYEHVVLSHPVWCRPCLLRECPLDHLCMTGLSVARVAVAARRSL